MADPVQRPQSTQRWMAKFSKISLKVVHGGAHQAIIGNAGASAFPYSSGRKSFSVWLLKRSRLRDRNQPALSFGRTSEVPSLDAC